MEKKQVPLAESDVVCVMCASSQIAESVNPAETWSSLVEQGERSNAVKKEGLCPIQLSQSCVLFKGIRCRVLMDTLYQQVISTLFDTPLTVSQYLINISIVT